MAGPWLVVTAPLRAVRPRVSLLRPEHLTDKVVKPLSRQGLKLAIVCADGPASGAGIPMVIADRLQALYPHFRNYVLCRTHVAEGLVAPDSGMTHAGELMISLRFESRDELADWPRLAGALHDRLGSPDLGSMVLVAPRAWFEPARKEFESKSASVVLSLSAVDLLSEAELIGCLMSLLLSLVVDEEQQQLCLSQATHLAVEIRAALEGRLDGESVDLVHMLLERWYASEREPREDPLSWILPTASSRRRTGPRQQSSAR